MTRFMLMAFIALVTACGPDESDLDAGIGDPIFTFAVPEAGVFLGYNYWIVLHNNRTGELIDSKEIIVGSPAVEFRSNKEITDKLIVTYVRYDDPYDVRISVYNDIEVGTKWTASYPFESDETEIPSYERHDFVIENVSDMFAFGSSDRMGSNIDGNLAHYEGMATGSFLFREGGEKEMFMIDNGADKARYKFVDKPLAGASINLDYNEMTEFDKYLNIGFPKTSNVDVEVAAYNKKDKRILSSYLMYNTVGLGNKTSVNIGFLDQFEFYKTQMKIGAFNFISIGPPPASVEYIAADNFSYVKSLSDFSLTTSLDYTYVKTLYLYSTQEDDITTSHQLQYHTTANYPKQLYTVTDELEQILKLDKSKLKFYNVEVHFWKGRNYPEAISYGFDPDYDFARPTEHSWVSIWDFPSM